MNKLTQHAKPSDSAINHGIHDHDEESEVAEVMRDVAPWAVSIFLHAALVLVAIMVVWLALPEVPEEEPIIPSIVLSSKPDSALSFKPEPDWKKQKQKNIRTVKRPERKPNLNVSEAKIDPKLLGVSNGGSAQANVFHSDVSVGNGWSHGFLCWGGNAKKIVYVVDASGSLLDTLPFVVVELKRSIHRLSEEQSFTVIFFNGDEAMEVLRPGLKEASSANKLAVSRWLDGGHVVPQGQASAVSAIKKALSYEPDLVLLLSDNITGRGPYEVSQPHLLAEVSKANRTGTKINTIQFLYADPLGRVRGMKPTLEMISEQSGGVYRFVSSRELGIGSSR